MERLLAHPAGLPLRHVDHSHRASPALTGKCVSACSGDPITARYFVEKNDTMITKRFQGDYVLTGPNRGTSRPRVSGEEAAKVLRHLVAIASGLGHSWRNYVYALESVKPLRITKRRVKLATVVYDDVRETHVTTYHIPQRADAVTADPDAPKEWLVEFLSDEYDEETGPQFVIDAHT